MISCIRFGRQNKLPIAIRGGGHNAGGLGVCDGGLVIDLSGMILGVDPATRTARASGGALWGEVDHATNAFGLAVPSGIISTTGVGRAYSRRRPRAFDPPVRPHHRQPAGRST